MPDLNDKEAVANGALILDGLQPGWFKRVDRERLKVKDPNCCILKYVFGNYLRGYFEVMPFSNKIGFYCVLNIFSSPRPIIKELWLNEINNRYEAEQHSKHSSKQPMVVA